MPFYKRIDDDLQQAPNFVHLPTGVSLTVDNHADHTYPVDGWFWFDTLDEALVALSNPATDSVTRFQARAALYQSGLLGAVETIMADSETPMMAKLAWLDAQDFKRTSPTLLSMASALNLTDAEVDALFALARTIEA